MVERTIDFTKQVYDKLRERKERAGLQIADQIRRAVAEEVGELEDG